MHINKIINLKAWSICVCCVSALTNAELMLVHANNTAAFEFAEHSTIALLEIIHSGLRLIWFCCGICTECILWCVRECFNLQHVCARSQRPLTLHCCHAAISIALNASKAKRNRYRAKPNAIIFVEFSREPCTFRIKLEQLFILPGRLQSLRDFRRERLRNSWNCVDCATTSPSHWMWNQWMLQQIIRHRMHCSQCAPTNACMPVCICECEWVCMGG